MVNISEIDKITDINKHYCSFLKSIWIGSTFWFLQMFILKKVFKKMCLFFRRMPKRI